MCHRLLSYVFKEVVSAIKKHLSFTVLTIPGYLCGTETTITAREHKTAKGREVRKRREENTPSAE